MTVTISHRQLEELWAEHLRGEFETRDVEATLATMVDELHLTLTHSRQMDWLLPNVPPTHRRITMDLVVVVQFRGDKLSTERIYWDHAGVLRQVGLLKD